MISNLITSIVLKVLDDKKVDEFAEKVAEKVAAMVLADIERIVKEHLHLGT